MWKAEHSLFIARQVHRSSVASAASMQAGDIYATSGGYACACEPVSAPLQDQLSFNGMMFEWMYFFQFYCSKCFTSKAVNVANWYIYTAI